jgi:DNA (cytosine-5)-methyltransferase 1
VNVLSLFSGIGGLELGLERAGMTVVGQVEIDPFCRQVLAKHWPEVPRHDDVRTAVEWWLGGDRPAVDVVAGGFPCQPFSVAASKWRKRTADERWGWPWMEEVIRVLRPTFVIVENVPALVADRSAFGAVLGDLVELGFDGEWGMVSACAMGAPHVRQRLFLVAYTDRVARLLAGQELVRPPTVSGLRLDRVHDDRRGCHWLAEPGLDRVVDGFPDGVDRLRALGNAVVPQVAEHIGRLVMGAAA